MSRVWADGRYVIVFWKGTGLFHVKSGLWVVKYFESFFGSVVPGSISWIYVVEVSYFSNFHKFALLYISCIDESKREIRSRIFGLAFVLEMGLGE